MIKSGVPCPATTVASGNGHTILDVCCGSRMFWLNKRDKRAVFTDIRCEHHTLCDGRKLHIMPDVIADFRALPFADGSFAQVIFDPPHLMRVGKKSWMGKKYGALNRETWQDDIRQGFSEAFRVLRPHGTLVFKWNETQIPIGKIIALTPQQPTIWQRTGKADKTHWLLFLKDSQEMSETDKAISVLMMKADALRKEGLLAEADAIFNVLNLLKKDPDHA
ncbi:class I SAM-dependent methyltransferase [Erwinia psidii]|uniref:Class I SAM-dependent methyltransferase n=1 Tax=Erwinia psidii TaxID=69224 RepID=A0A3N6SDJ0_9GAMM|nr:class I SAM-dependent methyltransferase [Erwinia psidii]MCX8965247.1 class I SAM-dependent methyltransferase [Erwinia psidii]RQM37953.1 class I SAM-dependent methyltransferase [Erwinia psidii]